MRNIILIVTILLFCQSVNSQDQASETVVDSLYREDQFYVGVTYNLLGNLPSGVSQNGFSSGFHFGFIRDMPINKKRNLAIGLGLGYSANSVNQNIQITFDEFDNLTYTTLTDNSTYSKNKFSQHLIELPFEFRWRSSTAEEYKFWRIYSGFKVGYVLANKSKYRGSPTNESHTNIKDFNDLQYALTFSFGYNTWNFYLYYSLNPIFHSDAQLDGQSIDMNAIKIGLIFYVL